MGKENLDLTGQVFGHLTVIEQVQGPNQKAGPCWKCKCDCGNETKAYTFQLRSGGKVSCGCARKRNRNEKRLEQNAVKAQDVMEVREVEEEKARKEWQACWRTEKPDPSRNGEILIIRVEDSYTRQPPYVDLARYSIRDGNDRYWSKTKHEHIPAFMVTGWMDAPKV